MKKSILPQKCISLLMTYYSKNNLQLIYKYLLKIHFLFEFNLNALNFICYSDALQFMTFWELGIWIIGKSNLMTHSSMIHLKIIAKADLDHCSIIVKIFTINNEQSPYSYLKSLRISEKWKRTKIQLSY